MMLKSRIFTVPIHRKYGEVYRFLAEPANFALWATEPDTKMVPQGGQDYLVELACGRRVMRFTQPNDFGVLDYQMFEPGARSGPVTPVRLHPNQEGCELILTWFQHPGVSDAQFASESEWAYSDLLRMKAYVEAG